MTLEQYAKKTIQAKETLYNGYRFRSRLEARWAVFFDAAGIEYQYEPEGYVLEDGRSYLPDFYLPYFHLFVEIKHDREHDNGKAKELCLMKTKDQFTSILIVYGDPLTTDTELHTWIYVPDDGDSQINVYTFHDVGFWRETASNTNFLLVCDLDQYCQELLEQLPEWDLFEMPHTFTVYSLPFPPEGGFDTFDRLEEAKLRARRAQFEYGRKP